MSFPTRLLESYDIISTDGLDAYGGAFRARCIDGDGEYETAILCAVKPAAKRNRQASRTTITPEHFEAEAYAMDFLNHENIAKLYESFIEVNAKPNVGVLVRERADGGTLFDELAKRRRFEEFDVRKIAVQVVGALKHMKDHGVVCGLLNLETIGYKTTAKDRVLLTSMRNATMIGQPAAFAQDFNAYDVENELGELEVRTYPVEIDLAYVAPELMKPGTRRRTPAVDVWSFGVILYTLLAGYTPFIGDDISDVVEAIRTGNYTSFQYDLETWNGVSKAAKDLIAGCLRVNVKRRFSIERILDHPWIRKFDGISGSITAGSAMDHSSRTGTYSESGELSNSDDYWGSDGETSRDFEFDTPTPHKRK
jgi:serine/threonine protein kinase